MSATVPSTGRPPLYDHRKLRAWREDAGLSREQVAVSVGCSAPWLAELEQGTTGRRPSLDLLHRLAACYGHQAAELLSAA